MEEGRMEGICIDGWKCESLQGGDVFEGVRIGLVLLEFAVELHDLHVHLHVLLLQLQLLLAQPTHYFLLLLHLALQTAQSMHVLAAVERHAASLFLLETLFHAVHLLHHHLHTLLQHTSLLSAATRLALCRHRPPLCLLRTANCIFHHSLRLLCLSTCQQQAVTAGLQTRQFLGVSFLQLPHLPLQFARASHQLPCSSGQQSLLLTFSLQLMKCVLEMMIVVFEGRELLLATVDDGTSLFQLLPQQFYVSLLLVDAVAHHLRLTRLHHQCPVFSCQFPLHPLQFPLCSLSLPMLMFCPPSLLLQSFLHVPQALQLVSGELELYLQLHRLQDELFCLPILLTLSRLSPSQLLVRLLQTSRTLPQCTAFCLQFCHLLLGIISLSQQSAHTAVAHTAFLFHFSPFDLELLQSRLLLLTSTFSAEDVTRFGCQFFGHHPQFTLYLHNTSLLHFATGPKSVVLPAEGVETRTAFLLFAELVSEQLSLAVLSLSAQILHSPPCRIQLVFQLAVLGLQWLQGLRSLLPAQQFRFHIGPVNGGGLCICLRSLQIGSSNAQLIVKVVEAVLEGGGVFAGSTILELHVLNDIFIQFAFQFLDLDLILGQFSLRLAAFELFLCQLTVVCGVVVVSLIVETLLVTAGIGV